MTFFSEPPHEFNNCLWWENMINFLRERARCLRAREKEVEQNRILEADEAGGIVTAQ